MKPTPTARPPLVRSGPGRLVAGVAEGVAAHLDLPVVLVRLAFTVLGGSGLGLLAYIALWILVPTDPDAVPGPGYERTLRRRTRRVAQLLMYLIVGGIVGGVLGAVGRPLGGTVLGPLALAGVGALLIWRRAPADQRSAWSAWSGDARSVGARYSRIAARWSSVWVAVAGTVLVVVGVAAFLAAHDALAQARAGALAILAVLTGVALVAGPWLLRLWRDLTHERRQRIRAEERAAVAAHVHDSVLQTLALLQARAGDPTAVRRLARRQERDLRAWLYGGSSGGTGPASSGVDGAATLGAELRRLCAEIEDDTGIDVEVVVVGDAPLDEQVHGLTAATREAVLNAAKSSGAPEVAVYAEADDRQIAVWVRDRGRGFDPGAVGPDRHGIRDSITGRMALLGGSSRVRSTVGSGCEVELVLPRPTTPRPMAPRPTSKPATPSPRTAAAPSGRRERP